MHFGVRVVLLTETDHIAVACVLCLRPLTGFDEQSLLPSCVRRFLVGNMFCFDRAVPAAPMRLECSPF